MIGKTFHWLTVLKEVERLRCKDGINQKRQFLCQCICGNNVTRCYNRLVGNGEKPSCGCYKHGLSEHRLYNIWQGIKRRCNNPKNPRYKDYGGRGISICEKWNYSFISFYKDVIDGYKDGLTLDRIDNNGNYCKENCRWVDIKAQNRNKRTNRIFTVMGYSKCASEWEEILGKNASANAIKRSNSGWSDDDAILGRKLEIVVINKAKILKHYEGDKGQCTV